MSAHDLLEALTPVVEVLERLGVPYHIGGSVASAVYGVARATLDIDLVTDLQPEHVQAFVDSLENKYYIDAEMIRASIRRRQSFNLIHLATMIKLDVFISGSQAFDRLAFERAQEDTLESAADTRRFYLASAEDVLVRKLMWYREGGQMSERQWADVIGVLKVQANRLDFAYLRRWSQEMGVADLLEQALVETKAQREG